MLCLAITCFVSIGTTFSDHYRDGKRFWCFAIVGSVVWGLWSVLDYVEEMRQIVQRLRKYEMAERDAERK
jgi:uncharacterized membrane protein YedE/YeeE